MALNVSRIIFCCHITRLREIQNKKSTSDDLKHLHQRFVDLLYKYTCSTEVLPEDRMWCMNLPAEECSRVAKSSYLYKEICK
jgi:hypothetical protein